MGGGGGGGGAEERERVSRIATIIILLCPLHTEQCLS